VYFSKCVDKFLSSGSFGS